MANGSSKSGRGLLLALLLLWPSLASWSSETQPTFENSYEGLLQITQLFRANELSLRKVLSEQSLELSLLLSNLDERDQTVIDLNLSLQTEIERSGRLADNVTSLRANLGETERSLRDSLVELGTAKRSLMNMDALLMKQKESLERAKRTVVISSLIVGVAGAAAGILVGFLAF